MDKWQALQSFWGSFGIPAYDENTVPDNAVMPYITYEAATGRLEDRISLGASLWYRSSSWADISQMASIIADALEVIIPCDGGYLYIFPGTVFARRMDEPEDDGVRRIALYIGAEFLTAK